MPLSRLRSRSLGFRIRAAAVAAVLVLIVVSVLASGDPKPLNDTPSTANGPAAGSKPLASADASGTDGPGESETPGGTVTLLDGEDSVAGGEGMFASSNGVLASFADNGDAGNVLAFSNGLPGGESDGNPAGPPAGGNANVVWDLIGFGPAFAGGNANGAPGAGDPSPGNSLCAYANGPANDCVQQSKDSGPGDTPIVEPASLSEPESPNGGTPSLTDTRPLSVPEPNGAVLASLALLGLLWTRRRLTRRLAPVRTSARR
jgi:hypothetical protein